LNDALGRVDPPNDLWLSLSGIEGQEMNEGLFYGLFFTGILLNYAMKLR
jgi:hypothetical protein